MPKNMPDSLIIFHNFGYLDKNYKSVKVDGAR